MELLKFKPKKLSPLREESVDEGKDIHFAIEKVLNLNGDLDMIQLDK